MFYKPSKKTPLLCSKKGWSDSKTFAKWWLQFLQRVRARTAKYVLLILDKCGSHGTKLIDPHGQVKVVILPPSCTSICQPMDCGVIAMVTKSYRYKLLQRFFDIFDTRAILRENAIKAKMKAGTMGLSEGHAPHLRDVMDILNEVWEEITAESVKNCWKMSTLT